MKVNLTTRTGSSWSPTELGRSLPIQDRLKWWRWSLVAVSALVGVVIVWHLWRGQHPRVEEPLQAADVEKLVDERLKRVELPPLDLGEPLSATEAPDFPRPEPPPPWDGVPPWDRTSSWLAGDLARARQELDAGRWTAAATLYRRLAERAPTGWLPRYHAGLALLARGDYTVAAEELEDALRRLQALPGGRAEPLAAEIATRRALALALLPDDCIGAIGHLKAAVGSLEPYRRAADVLVYEADLPFTVEPAGFDNHAVWLALVHAYTRCGDRYPKEYMAQLSRPRTFLDEYDDPDVDEVRSGPFPEELAGCIATARAELHSESARCWALSNLNRLYYANRSAYRRIESAEGLSSVEHPVVLARLAHAVAWMLVQREEEWGRASDYLQQAQALAREAEDEVLEERIAALGRHLAPLTGDYSTLAEAYRGRSPESLELDDRSTPEEVKGVAWYLRERWSRLLQAGDAGRVIDEVEEQRARAGPYGPELLRWKEELQERLRAELVTAMRDARNNGYTARAVALRDLEAPYLGEEWEETAAHGWRPYGWWALWFFGWLLLAGLLWGLYRFVVYPYLVDTTDYYRIEFNRRGMESKRPTASP